MNNALAHFDLTGKTALITGGATGIGLAMTKALAGAGATVMMAARRDHVLKQAAADLGPDVAGELLWHTVDLMNPDSVEELAQHATKTMGSVDVFIGNAGAEAQQRIEDITDDAIEQQIRVNLTANMQLTRALLPGMRKRKWGRFIFCSSAASGHGSSRTMQAVYGAAKSGINGFTRYVAAEGGPDGITANSLVLGIFLTEMLEQHIQDAAGAVFLDELQAMTALGRPAKTDEIAGVVQLLASDAGSYVTGTSFAVDGGLTTMLFPHTIPGA
ncbi:MAG TPA: SDR family oxidoreductase [Pseudonocardia sp.]|jgi:gluconate 5-dehydrogenase|nr:SDR family oxidoreductase [Pseudonocardia sp.]